eukprot:scaffold26564_cov122-Cylindrotheca_fusiformis.AAC.1
MKGMIAVRMGQKNNPRFPSLHESAAIKHPLVGEKQAENVRGEICSRNPVVFSFSHFQFWNGEARPVTSPTPSNKRALLPLGTDGNA